MAFIIEEEEEVKPSQPQQKQQQFTLEMFMSEKLINELPDSARQVSGNFDMTRNDETAAVQDLYLFKREDYMKMLEKNATTIATVGRVSRKHAILRAH